MEIREAKSSDYPEIARLLKSFFPVHNIFQKSQQEIILYLDATSKKDKVLICADKSNIPAVTFLVRTDKSIEGSHTRWKFRHFCYTNENSALLLLKESESIIKKESKTAKIELTIAENEKSLKFFMNNGYKEEGKLKNHYRPGEITYVLGKFFD